MFVHLHKCFALECLWQFRLDHVDRNVHRAAKGTCHFKRIRSWSFQVFSFFKQFSYAYLMVTLISWSWRSSKQSIQMKVDCMFTLQILSFLGPQLLNDNYGNSSATRISFFSNNKKVIFQILCVQQEKLIFFIARTWKNYLTVL